MFEQAPIVQIGAPTVPAVSKSALKAFSDRLHSVCDDLQIATERGRESQFARMFKVTPNAARKWSRGQGMPELSRAIEICSRARVSVVWLLQGVGDRKLPEAPMHSAALSNAVNALPPAARAEVIGFVRHKIEKSAPTLATEDLTRFLAALDGEEREVSTRIKHNFWCLTVVNFRC